MSSQDNVMQIPGYYYDPVKKKYFKVMATGPYSRQNYQNAENEQSKMKEPAVRRHTRITPLPSYCRLREMQGRKSVVKSISNGYLGLLATLGQPQKMTVVGTPLAQTTATIAGGRPVALDIHPTNNRYWLAYTTGIIAEGFFSISPKDGFQQYHITLTPYGSDEITGVSMGAGDIGMVCTLGNGGRYPTLFFSRLSYCNPDQEPSNYRQAELIDVKALNHWGSFWCCDISKLDESRSVLGTDKTVVYYNNCKPVAYYYTDSAVLAAQIDPVQPNVFYGGCRDGRIKLFDSRVSRRNVDARRGHSPHIFRHKSAITHLHKIGSSFHIVAAGMDGSLQTWDMRGHRTSSHTAYQQRQWPVFRFNGHKNVHTRSLGFDVLDDGKVLAMAGDDHVVRLWSLQGDNPNPVNSIQMSAAVPSLKFCAHFGRYQTPKRSLGMLVCTNEKETPLQWLSVGASK